MAKKLSYDQIAERQLFDPLVKEIDELNKKLDQTAEKLKAKLEKGVVVLASVSPNKAFLVAVSTEKSLSADKIIKEVSHLAGGSGGGRWDFAQGGTSQGSKVQKALDKVPSIVEKYVLLAKK